ncbi:tRNA pseudouridine(55) synthase TruB [Candidatus Parcubacteria bacterium]|uniref:tRNA pseudouridine(55) synthase n=1 Tax=Candidatus Kaiserbacteria bacterium CG10_big_fil_rev_8_21_14_0_10_47_16 TaxID=1974608 RepID=A0A2H0UD14_9BACT|nr:tRNA pseudouridine(55) synthase TruB [Candidatus Parcubacteria bacterium]PIR84314.1 MAG: tRNA pseudouridine(55) synthase TruB [Candidatus Kaiserbacteria bacterium CG10_big_fil_rev_8_21_14_0_10_47_16]
MKPETVPELLLIDKPQGITSFDVIRRLRRELGIKKMGHAGTLDPLASGLMLIGVGPGTKKLTQYVKLPKEYMAEILVGERRLTGDMEGKILEEKEVTDIPQETILETLAGMVGALTLPVSSYSAIKKDGVPMYKRARQAEKVGKQVLDVPLRDMVVTEAKYFGHRYEDGRCIVIVRFAVSSGTYIRSLAEEFGKRLGYPATLKNLRRTKVGEFDVENARQI